MLRILHNQVDQNQSSLDFDAIIFNGNPLWTKQYEYCIFQNQYIGFGFLCGKEITPGREHISLESSCLANVCTRIHLPSRYSSIFLKSPINNKISSSFGLHFLHFLLIFFICFFVEDQKRYQWCGFCV